MIGLGIILSVVTLLAWGFGDFFIQDSSRRIGSWPTLLVKSLVGAVALSFFVADEIYLLFNLPAGQLALLLLTIVVMMLAILFSFIALRDGKISVVVPIISLELPLTVILSVFFGHNPLTWLQIILIALIFIGVLLVITQQRPNWRGDRLSFEKGVAVAGAGAICLGLGNFLVGTSSQTISPLLTIWSIQVLALILTSLWFIVSRQSATLWLAIKRFHPSTILQAIFDNTAWVTFAFATTFVSIGVVTGISEGYVVVAALLGIWWGHEKLKRHQIIGVVVTIAAILLLAVFTV